MAVGYVADCQRSMLPPQCMEGGRGKRERERERSSWSSVQNETLEYFEDLKRT
jgi:hypothetical protein